MKTSLVINGDDAGAYRQGDEDLLMLARKGVMRSVSVLVNGASVNTFIPTAKDLGLSLGLHFNLSDGRPTGGPYNTITDKNGFFYSPKQQVWEKAAQGLFDPDEVAAEATCQWQALANMGVCPDHLDGHNHIQVFACVFQGLTKSLGEKKLYFRIPEEPECPLNLQPLRTLEKLKGDHIRKLSKKQWQFTNRFAGYTFTHIPSEDGISHLKKIRSGIVELMTHPSQRPGSVFTAHENRRKERDYLASNVFSKRVQDWGYELTGFGV